MDAIKINSMSPARAYVLSVDINGTDELVLLLFGPDGHSCNAFVGREREDDTDGDFLSLPKEQAEAIVERFNGDIAARRQQ